MKTLTKKKCVAKNTVEAYALGCACTCTCFCIKIGPIDLYGSGYGDTFSQISMMPKVG